MKNKINIFILLGNLLSFYNINAMSDISKIKYDVNTTNTTDVNTTNTTEVNTTNNTNTNTTTNTGNVIDSKHYYTNILNTDNANVYSYANTIYSIFKNTTIIKLKKGWNLISSPYDCKAIDTKIFILQSIPIYIYDENNITYYSYPEKINTSKGAWVYSDTNFDMDLKDYLIKDKCEDIRFNNLENNKWYLLGTQKGLLIKNIPYNPNKKRFLYNYNEDTKKWLINPIVIAPGKGFWYYSY